MRSIKPVIKFITRGASSDPAAELPVRAGRQRRAEPLGDSNPSRAELLGRAAGEKAADIEASRSINSKCSGCHAVILDSAPRVHCLECVSYVCCANCHLSGADFGVHKAVHQCQVFSAAGKKRIITTSSRKSAIELQMPATPSGYETDLEFELAGSLQRKAIAQFEAGDYASAEGFASSAIKHLEAAQGAQFRGRNELFELIAISCWKQEKYCEAEQLLLNLINVGNVQYNDDFRLLDALAKVFMGKGDLDKAARYCHEAVQGRRSVFGKDHVLFLDSVALLVQLYKAKGDNFEAQGYEETFLKDAIPGVGMPPELPNNHKSPYMRIILHSRAVLRGALESSMIGRRPRSTATQWLEENHLTSALVSDSKDVTAQALHRAAAEGHVEVIRLLLEKGADVNAHSHYQCHNLTVINMHFNWQNIGDPEDGHSSPLHAAAEHGHTVALKILLDSGAHIHDKDNHGRTALHYAAWHESEETVRLLLDRGANMEDRTICSGTALQYAVMNGSEATVRLLLDRGANIEAKDLWIFSPLHHAVKRERQEIARLLVERGADPGARSAGGFTVFEFSPVSEEMRQIVSAKQ
jgi:tetratricopeptide (TPR) repeat protein